MSDVAIVKIVELGIGALIMIVGAILFVLGVQRGGARIKTSAKLRGLHLAMDVDKGGPGLAIAVLGAVVLVVAVWKGVWTTDIETDSDPNTDQQVSTERRGAAKKDEPASAPNHVRIKNGSASPR